MMGENFLIALTALTLTAAILFWLLRKDSILLSKDIPSSRGLHQHVVPRGGGLVIFVAVAIMAALNLSHQVLVMKSGGQPEDPLEEQLKTITSRIDEALFQLRQFEIS